METKLCRGCGKTKNRSEFYKRWNRPGGIQSKCKECQNSKRSGYYKPNEKIRQQLKISDELYEELMKNDSCQICGTPLIDMNKDNRTKERHGNKKCIDHCHETKKIRGVLCTRCNTGLGLFKDNVEVMRNAIQYLEQSKQLQ